MQGVFSDNMGCAPSSAAALPLGDLFADTFDDEPGARRPRRLEPASTPAEWLAFFDLQSPEADAIVEAYAALGATRAADVLLVSEEELASMRRSLQLPIPRRKFDRALRALQAAAKHRQSRERPGSAAAFCAEPRPSGADGEESPTLRESGGVGAPISPGRCPFCDNSHVDGHGSCPGTAQASPAPSPSRGKNVPGAGDEQPWLRQSYGGATPWNPWQQQPNYSMQQQLQGHATTPQFAGLAAGPLVNNAPMLPPPPPITPIGLHTTLPYFQQPLWQQSQQLQQQQQALLAATQAAQAQQWHSIAGLQGWPSPAPNANWNDRRPQSAAVTAQEQQSVAAATALKRHTKKHGEGSKGNRRTKPSAAAGNGPTLVPEANAADHGAAGGVLHSTGSGGFDRPGSALAMRPGLADSMGLSHLRPGSAGGHRDVHIAPQRPWSAAAAPSPAKHQQGAAAAAYMNLGKPGCGR